MKPTAESGAMWADLTMARKKGETPGAQVAVKTRSVLKVARVCGKMKRSRNEREDHRSNGGVHQPAKDKNQREHHIGGGTKYRTPSGSEAFQGGPYEMGAKKSCLQAYQAEGGTQDQGKRQERFSSIQAGDGRELGLARM